MLVPTQVNFLGLPSVQVQRLTFHTPPSTLPAGTSELRVDLTDFDGKHEFAKYSSFRIQGEAEKYKLVLGNFVGGGAGEQLGKRLEMGGASEPVLEERGPLFVSPW